MMGSEVRLRSNVSLTSPPPSLRGSNEVELSIDLKDLKAPPLTVTSYPSTPSPK